MRSKLAEFCTCLTWKSGGSWRLQNLLGTNSVNNVSQKYTEKSNLAEEGRKNFYITGIVNYHRWKDLKWSTFNHKAFLNACKAKKFFSLLRRNTCNIECRQTFAGNFLLIIAFFPYALQKLLHLQLHLQILDLEKLQYLDLWYSLSYRVPMISKHL